ncbi:MAG: hypothetical protein WD749_09435 [Phycisphaerales bacterium]
MRMIRRVAEWLEARRIDASESPGAAMRLERMLREEAGSARAGAPRSLRAGVYRRLDGMPPGGTGQPRWPYWIAVPAMAALVALMAIPWPRPAAESGAAGVEGTLAIGLPLDSRPVIIPAAAFVDGPLMEEAGLIVRDTRRATQLVMECLPLPGPARGVTGGGG